MGVFENFPYTNFHDLNLDWILTTVKGAVVDIASYKEIMTANYSSLLEKVNTNYNTLLNKINSNYSDLNTRKEDSVNITNNRKLSATGNFTGTLSGRTQVSIFSDINESLSLSRELIEDINNRESIGTVYDGGNYVDTEPPTYSIDGGVYGDIY